MSRSLRPCHQATGPGHSEAQWKGSARSVEVPTPSATGPSCASWAVRGRVPHQISQSPLRENRTPARRRLHNPSTGRITAGSAQHDRALRRLKGTSAANIVWTPLTGRYRGVAAYLQGHRALHPQLCRFHLFVQVSSHTCFQQFYASSLQPMHPSHLIVTSPANPRPLRATL